MNRRTFMKSTGIIGAGIGLAGLECSGLWAAGTTPTALNTDKLGWRLGMHAYTLKKFTMFEVIDKTAELGLKHIESLGLVISKDHSAKFSHEMPVSVRKDLQKKLADSDVTILTHFFSKRLKVDRKLFDFCKEMGTEAIVHEPPLEHLDEIEELCDEYKINLAIANHPSPGSRYWHPKVVMKVCKGRSKRIGASGDIGWWVRESLNPLECVKALEGRLLAFHFRDMSKSGSGTHDVPWGTGTSDVRAILKEVLRQGAKPAFMIEHAHKDNVTMEALAQSIQYYNKVVAELAAEGASPPLTPAGRPVSAL